MACCELYTSSKLEAWILYFLQFLIEDTSPSHPLRNSSSHALFSSYDHIPLLPLRSDLDSSAHIRMLLYPVPAWLSFGSAYQKTWITMSSHTLWSTFQSVITNMGKPTIPWRKTFFCYKQIMLPFLKHVRFSCKANAAKCAQLFPSHKMWIKFSLRPYLHICRTFSPERNVADQT